MLILIRDKSEENAYNFRTEIDMIFRKIQRCIQKRYICRSWTGYYNKIGRYVSNLLAFLELILASEIDAIPRTAFLLS